MINIMGREPEELIETGEANPFRSYGAPGHTL
jgi:hypothetical protein